LSVIHPLRTSPVKNSEIIRFSIRGLRCDAVRARFGTERFARHFHDDTFSFGLVTAGANVFSYRGRFEEVAAGTLGIADPGEIHDGGLSGRPWAYVNLYAPVALMADMAAEAAGLDGVPAFAVGQIHDPDCRVRFANFFNLLFNDPAAELADIEETAIDALGRLIAGHAVGSRSDGAAVDSPVVRLSLEMLHDCFDTAVSLDDLAHAAGASPFTVIRAVSAATGLTPHAYLVQLRVKHAKTLIGQGVLIAQAALDAGFADQAHLTRAMKQRWGTTPGAFKAARRKGG
jgi:AraC-like DNA-binding protein